MPGDWVRVSALIPERVAVSIPNGQSLSAPAFLNGGYMNGVRLPNSAGWTTANITFMVSMDGGKTYGDLYLFGSEYVITVPAGRTNATVFGVDPKDFASYTHVIVRSGTAALPVAQGGARELQIGCVP